MRSNLPANSMNGAAGAAAGGLATADTASATATRRYVRQESLVASGGLALAAVLFVIVAGAAYWSADHVSPSNYGLTLMAAVGGIGSTAMLALLFLYRSLRRRLSGLMAVRDALLSSSLSGGTAAPGAVMPVNPALGPEAQAWNLLVAERDQVRREALAEKAREALGRRRQARGDLDAACDAMSQGLILFDDQGQIKYANGAAATFLRVDREKMVNADVGVAIKVDSVVAAVRQVVAGTSRRRSVIDVDRKAESKGTDSTAGVLRFSVRPVRREDAASAMIVIEDITQQKAAEEARHAFVAQATHELRTPLTNIRLYVETAIEDGEADPSIRVQALNVINSESRRLERIVGEMLSVAEIEAGAFKLKSDDVRLDQLFDGLKQDYQQQAMEKKIALVFVLPPKLPVLQADREKVAVALHNLVGNALKYTPAGGSVTVRVDADDKQLAVAVADTGIGISEEDCQKIFERFYRANDNRVDKITGTGLGLTIAREVARLHGGDITVESQLNKGSTFTLALPLKTAA
ncbi:sensor histidine kinase [Humisphaera borealis]|uniref:histidine kinase n=1 Tax=Humisphaera borealis TaxID=2807512 RepID=A0A7M2X5H1_9BACT|nr:ATP-binding protein [Humisphaera borealis]QOV92050.1 PAS domain S-box protein [Humisphaera borealis]